MSALAVAPVECRMGAEYSAKTLYRDPPYGGLILARHEFGDSYQLLMSEHTDIDAVRDMWNFLPINAIYVGAEEIRNGFGRLSKRCVMHRFFDERRALRLVRRLTAEVFFATQKLV